MHKNFGKLLSVLVVTMLVSSFFTGCGQTSSNSVSSNKDKPKNIKLSMWCSEYTPEETKEPQAEWMISKAIKEFESENPGVTIDLNVTTPSPQTFAKFKAATLAKNGPDIISLWTGNYLFDMKDTLLTLNKYIPKDDLKNITAWNTVTNNFQKNGDILAYPVGANYGVLMYNKQLVKNADLNFDTNPPKTTGEFKNDLETIKKTGVIPLVEDANTGGMLMDAADYWWVQKTGYDGLIKLGNGTMKFSNDKGLLDMLKYTQSLYSSGLINKDASSSADSNTVFYSGKAAIRTAGTWDIKDSQSALGAANVGILPLPIMVTSGSKVNANLIGGAGDCTAISKNTKYPQMAVKFLSFLSSKKIAINVCKDMGYFPVRNDITFQDLGWSDNLHKQLLEYSKQTAFWVDNSIPADYFNELVTFFPDCLVGKISAKNLAAQVDKKVAETTEK